MYTCLQVCVACIYVIYIRIERGGKNRSPGKTKGTYRTFVIYRYTYGICGSSPGYKRTGTR